MIIVRAGSREGASSPALPGASGDAMTTGGRDASSKALAEKGIGSSRISLQRRRQSSQIYAAPGPATMRWTAGGRRRQNEQRASDRSKLMENYLWSQRTGAFSLPCSLFPAFP